MKRLLFSAAMFLCCAATSFAQFSGSGSGTENDPYLILNPIQLNQMRNFLNQSEVYFKLMADIDLTEFIEDEYGSQGWLPIGTTSLPFKGVFDGNGKTISGLFIDRKTTENVGFFACASNLKVNNLTLKYNIKGYKNVGSLVGLQKDNCEYSNLRIDGSVEGVENVGGLIGSGEIKGYNCKCENITAKVNVFATGNNAGGIVGEGLNFSCKNCKVIDSSITGNDYVGGISGVYGDVIDSFFTGRIKGNSNIGGIAGAASISKCCVIGTIIATGNNVGGLLGSITSKTLSESYFNGTVTGKKSVGGLVGKGYYLEKSYANATVKGNANVGGICGSNSGGSIKKCIYSGLLLSATEGEIGRIYGSGYCNVGNTGTTDENKAYNRTIVIDAGVAQDINDNEKNGTGVSASTLKLKATYVAMGYDFNNMWAIQETECYPYFKWQTAPPVITSQVVSGATTVSGKCVSGTTVTLEIDGVKQQMVSTGNTFSFTVSPLQAGHEVRVSAKADGKEQSYYTTEVVSFLGKGTEVDPYQISTAADLTQVYRKGYYKLMNDIDLASFINQFSPTEGWESIGREGSETIHFDGDGHKITGLWCNSTRDNTGLFSCFANGTIKNLTVETAQGKQVKGGSNTGILIGKMMNGTIENCRVSGTVADGTPVGGMVGLFDGGTISRCYANVTINTTLATSYVGGLVGEISDGEIDQCVATGTLAATGSESYVGGLIGKNYATVTNCYSLASVHSSYSAVGLAAYNYGIVDKCYATGDLFSSNYAAGIIGYNDGSKAVVKNCVAMNNKIEVTYESQSAQGGGYGQRIIGGIKNGAPAPEMNNYALKTMQVSVNDVPQKVYDDIMNGVSKEKTDLTRKTIYEQLGWNFTSIWNIETEGETPFLRNVGKINSVIGEPDNDDPMEEDTDNTLALGQVSAHKGQQTELPIALTNKHSITGLQFDLYLPDGVTVATNSRGKMIVTTTSRMDGTYSISSSQMDGFVRVLGYSADGDAFAGNSGDILNVTLNIDERVADGDYTVQLKDIVLSDVNSTEFHPADAQATLTVKSYTLGDVDNSGAININDVVCIINHILNKQVGTFIAEAADVDGSGAININDVVTLINRFILHRENAPIYRAPSLAPITDTNYLHLADIDLKPGETKEVEMILTNDNTVSAVQGNIRLPEGLSFVTKSNGRVDAKNIDDRSEDFTLSCAIQDDGSMTFAHYSADGYTYEGNEGGIFTLKVKADENIAVGNYDVALTGVVLSINGVGYELTNRTSTVTIVGTTGINSVDNGELKIDNWYTIDGKKLAGEPKEKGVYIRNGRKVIK